MKTYLAHFAILYGTHSTPVPFMVSGPFARARARRRARRFARRHCWTLQHFTRIR